MNNLIGIAGVAALIGLTPGTVKVMRAHGDLPDPDVVVDGRTILWREATIVEWDQARPKRYDNRKSST